jgi:SlyX protein
MTEKSSDNSDSTSDAIVELQTKVAFFEQHINELSDVMYSQQKQLDQLNIKYSNLKNHLAAMENAEQEDAADPSDERPPHY